MAFYLSNYTFGLSGGFPHTGFAIFSLHLVPLIFFLSLVVVAAAVVTINRYSLTLYLVTLSLVICTLESTAFSVLILYFCCCC